MPLAPGARLGRYEVVAVLGVGGMGEVYKVRDTNLNRMVAIKAIPAHLAGDPERRARFDREARAVAALSHQNICTLHDVLHEGDRAFLVMEYVEGETLATRLERGPLPPDAALKLATELAAALDAAHRGGIVHRDLKPGNIMLTPAGLKLLDFGIAKVGDGVIAGSDGATVSTLPGTMLGTLEYMSPEQAFGRPLDARSDLFSFGAVLYEALTARPAFKGESDVDSLDRVLHARPEGGAAARRSVEIALWRVVRKCLEKDPDRRFQTAAELLSELTSLERQRHEPPRQAIDKPSIVVLPFEDLSPAKDNEYFSDGLSEELITDLSGVAGVRVVSRTTSMRLKGHGRDVASIARELAVHYVLDGSVRKSGSDLRITAQLIDASTDTQLWGGKYTGSLNDVFDIQEQVSRQIVDALKVTLTLQETVGLTKRATLNPEAFDLALRGRHLLDRFTRRDLLAAVELFQEAIARDSRYAPAFAGLAEAHATIYQEFERRERRLDAAMEAAFKALLYDPALPDAYAALGLAHFNKGALEDAVVASQRAVQLDPDNFIGYWTLARIYHLTDRDQDALEMFQKVIALKPDYYPVYGYIRMVFERLGKRIRYQPILKVAIERIFPRYLATHPEDARAHEFFGIELSEAGVVEQGRAEMSRALELAPDDALILYGAACFHARLGETRTAVHYLKRAIDAGFENIEWMARDPDLESLRTDPVYLQAVQGRSSTSVDSM